MGKGDIWEIGVGQSARIKEYDGEDGSPAMRRRLMDMGFTEGAEVKCVLIAPRGGMKAYMVRSSVIALREGDARLIKTGEAYEQ